MSDHNDPLHDERDEMRSVRREAEPHDADDPYIEDDYIPVSVEDEEDYNSGNYGWFDDEGKWHP